MRRIFIWSFAAFLLCGARSTAIHSVSPADAEKLLAEGGVLLLDVRTDTEFQGGRIPGAQSMPLNELSKRMTQITDKTQTILVYCDTGTRSAKAARMLYREGYKDVYNLSGGLRAWTAAQKPIQVQAVNGKAASVP